MRHPRLLTALPLLALLAALAPATASAADDTRTWAVVPAAADGPDGRGEFSYIAQPGEAVVDHAAVRNFGTSPLTVELSVQDATQSEDGTFELLEPEEEPSGVGAWVRLEQHQLTVPPRSSLVVEFTLEVPAGAEPGDHAGGLVAVSAVEQEDGSAVQYRVGSRLHVRVGGSIAASLALASSGGRYDQPAGPLAPGTLALEVSAENTGNLRLAPTLTARASTLFGVWTTETQLADYGELLPGSRVARPVVLDGAPPLGPVWITIDVAGTSSRGQDATDATTAKPLTVVVWAMPWIPLALLAVAALALAAGLGIRRARRLAHVPPFAE
ncbi:MAG: DUF916 domain-containing protein [Protaetiibacter sp.]